MMLDKKKSRPEDSSQSMTGATQKSLANSTQVSDPAEAHAKQSRRVSRSRFVFITGLVFVAAALAMAAFYILKSSETKQAEIRFESIAERALTSAAAIVERKKLGVVTMADTAAWAQPNANEWPFVIVPGWEELAKNARETSGARSLGFCPFVTPDQLDDFEEFAYDYYYNVREPPFPNTTAVSDFGRGVWGLDKGSPWEDGKVPANPDANNTWGSPNKVFSPILQHSHIWRVLMLNTNFEPTRGIMIDELIRCSQDRAQAEDPSNFRCGVLTDMLNLASEEQVEFGPDSLLFEPIYPAMNKTIVSGLVVSSLVWRESLENVFAGDVNGVDCVVSTDTLSYTYKIKDGEAIAK